MGCRVREAREPDKDLFALTHGQRGKGVWATFRHERPQQRRAGLHHRHEGTLPEVEKTVCGSVNREDAGYHQPPSGFASAVWRAMLTCWEREARPRTRWTQEQNIIGVDHRGVGGCTGGLPDRATKIKG